MLKFKYKSVKEKKEYDPGLPEHINYSKNHKKAL
jgi:hypothetical protein